MTEARLSSISGACRVSYLGSAIEHICGVDVNSENKLNAHLFICTNHKGEGANCGSKNSQVLRDGLKKWAKEAHPEWKGLVRVNSSGCLGHCKRGITAVLYPEGRWFTQLTQDDHAVLAQALTETVAALPNGQ